MRPHGRARANSKNPQAFAICDNCGFLWNHSALRWQYDWAGNKLINKRQLVCRRCNDNPQNQLRAIILPADPVPVMNPRVQNYAAASDDIRQTSGQNTIDPVTGIPIITGNIRVTQTDQSRAMQEVGNPLGLDPTFSPLPAIDVTSVSASSPYVVTVSTVDDHGLATGNNIGIEGLTATTAMGAFTIVVTSTTTFTYKTNLAMSVGSISTPTTRLVKMIVGLPYGMAEIPKTGT